MSSLAHTPAAVGIHALTAPRASQQGQGPFKLLPSGDGWSLVAPDGELLFYGLGTHARRQCLEFARAHGVLAVFS